MFFGNYKERKKIKAIFGINDELLDFADKCLSNLEPYEKDIVKQTMIDGISIRQYSKLSGVNRDAVTKERNRILNMLVAFFNMSNITDSETNIQSYGK